MTSIDFYILAASEQEERLLFVCRLVEKAYKLGHKVYIHAEGEEHAQLIDECLWNYRNDSFVPHSIVKESEKILSPVEVGHNIDPKNHHDLLVNLANELPVFFSRFHRVSEVVIQDPEILKHAREHFTFYRDRGYPIKNHDLRQK